MEITYALLHGAMPHSLRFLQSKICVDEFSIGVSIGSAFFLPETSTESSPPALLKKDVALRQAGAIRICGSTGGDVTAHADLGPWKSMAMGVPANGSFIRDNPI